MKDKDFIRSTFRTLNIQAAVGLVLILLLPYVIAFQLVDDLTSDVWMIARNYAAALHEEFSLDPSRETAMRLAEGSGSIIGFEGRDGFWYTDGEAVHEISPDMPRPYYRGIWRAFDSPQGERFVVCWPSQFFVPAVHIHVFLSWLLAPFVIMLLLFYLIRRTLRPMRWVQTGINEVASGNLDFEAPVTGRDQKNLLSRRFNAMTASIRELITSKDQLIMDVSHELRSPITRIKVALEMLKEESGGAGEENPRIVTLEKNVHELEDIISTILEAQRINLQELETHKEPCRPGEIIRQTAELMQDAGPGFDLQMVDDTLVVEGDRGLLKLLIHNLLDNAAKYSTAGSAPVLVRLRRAESKAILEILDDGIGIDEQHLGRVFDPFYKVARERGFNRGYGLGLSLCKRIVELHGGSIRLENRESGGLKVTVVLELTRPALVT